MLNWQRVLLEQQRDEFVLGFGEGKPIQGGRFDPAVLCRTIAFDPSGQPSAADDIQGDFEMGVGMPDLNQVPDGLYFQVDPLPDGP